MSEQFQTDDLKASQRAWMIMDALEDDMVKKIDRLGMVVAASDDMSMAIGALRMQVRAAAVLAAGIHKVMRARLPEGLA